MIFAIDFDGTFAADPDMFRLAVRLLRARGHGCFLITNRREDQGAEVKLLVGDLMPIVFAGPMSKYDAAFAAGYDVDIWIDDAPHIVNVSGIVYVGDDDPHAENCGNDGCSNPITHTCGYCWKHCACGKQARANAKP